MNGYTKLSSTLITSTVWRESAATRVVWITFLAMKNQHGEVWGSIPGMADMARVTVAECEAALAVLTAPDPYSRSHEHDGRRLRPIDGGWIVINHEKYRDLFNAEQRRTLTAARVRSHRARRAQASETPKVLPSVTGPLQSVTSNESNAIQIQIQKQIQNGELQQQQPSRVSRQKPRNREADRASRETWLTPAATAWHHRLGPGTFPFGQAAAVLKPLLAAGATPEDLGVRLGWYLDMRGDTQGHDKPPDRRGTSTWTPNLRSFALTYGLWDPQGVAV